MAGTPYDPMQYEDSDYNPLRDSSYQPPEQTPGADTMREMEDFAEATRLLGEDFSFDNLPESSPRAEPDDAYNPPSTFEEAEASLIAAEKAIAAREAELEAFTSETRAIMPFTRESAKQVIHRGKLIAMSRRDLAKMKGGILSARSEIEKAKQAASEDPSFWQSALGVAGKVLSPVGWLLEHSPLAGLVETLGGMASYGASGVGSLLGTSYAESGVNEGTALERLRDSPLNPYVWWQALGGSPDADLRRRGREFYKKAGASLGSFEKEVILTTPVWREFHQYNPVALTVTRPMRSAIEGTAILGKYGGTGKFEQLSAAEQDAVRDMQYEVLLQAASDPLNLLEAGPVTKLGKLRALARVNAGSNEAAALAKTLDEFGEIGAKLGKGADEAAQSGRLVNELRKAGMSGDEAADLAKRFDEARRANMKELRTLASVDPNGWAETVRPYVDRMGKGTTQRAARLEALDKIGEFEDADPIIGRTWREQAELGQRSKVLQHFYDRFGDSILTKGIEKGWAKLTGQSLLADIADDSEALDWYFAQRAFKADAGSEVLRFQQDMAKRQADLLNKFNEAQRAKLFEELPQAVEAGRTQSRAVARALAGKDPMKQAVFDLADFYDESAETLKAIENRFGLDVADLQGQFGYFGREFSDELKQFILENPDARKMLFGETTKRSKESLSASLLPQEMGRKTRDYSFADSEDWLRKTFKEMGYTGNTVWSRNAFGNLAERSQRSAQKAELRNLYKQFVEAHAGKMDGETADLVAGAVHVAREQRAAQAAAKVDDAVAKGKGVAKAVKAESVRDVDKFTPKAKAQWILAQGFNPPKPGQANALEIMLKANVEPPGDWNELARLAATNVDTDAARTFEKISKGMYWQHIDTPNKWLSAYDSLKGIYQRSTLARVASLTKDLFGTAVNGLMSGNINYLDRAMRDVGPFKGWAEGAKRGKVATRLKGMGILQTTKGEALEKAGAIETLLAGKGFVRKVAGRAAGNIEKHGVIGGTLKSMGLKNVGEKAGKGLGTLNDARVYWEEVNRVATYMKAVDEGMSEAEAINEVYKFWGKFDELTRLDKKVLSRILFFWTWMARSIPVSMAHLLTHPVRSKWLLNAMAGDIDNETKAPNWIKRMGAWVLGHGENGNIKAINLGGSTYFSPTFAMLQGQFANRIMDGKPMNAASGALFDLARATPPFVQAIGELAMQRDFFTDKPWWREKNAQAVSNAKAPAVLWWLYSEEGKSGGIGWVSDLLGLKPAGKMTEDGQPAYLSMDPRWSWFFGSLPGLEPALSDVSAFFRPPERDLEGAAARPEFAPGKGLARMAGFPVYDIPVDDARQQLIEFKNALGHDADELSGGSLYVSGGRVSPNRDSWRGRAIEEDMTKWRTQARREGKSVNEAEDFALEGVKLKYPSEWRILALQKRLHAWEDHLIRMEKGEAEIGKELGRELEMLARRTDYSRAKKEQARALEREFGFK